MKRREIIERMEQLRPAVDEYIELQRANDALGAVGAASAGNGQRASVTRVARPRVGVRTAAARAASPRPRRTGGGDGRRRAGRPKGSGGRANEALALIQAQPGIRVAELAQRMGIKPNYLYRVLPGLEREKKIKKRRGSWHPTRQR